MTKLAYIKWQKQDLINLFLLCVSLMVWIIEYKSTSAQNEFCSPIIYSRLPGNTLCNLTRTNTLHWSNTWDTWEKRTSGMWSCITPASVAGEKQWWKAEEWSLKKKTQGEEFPEAWEPTETVCCKAVKEQLRDKSTQRCPAANQQSSSCLCIYSEADRFLHR